MAFFFFQKKKLKALFCFAEAYFFYPSGSEAGREILEACPQIKELIGRNRFPEKSLIASQKSLPNPNFGDADQTILFSGGAYGMKDDIIGLFEVATRTCIRRTLASNTLFIKK
jgi:MoaA/NifB/PqqE/SkfB family radical SAM enzyme